MSTILLKFASPLQSWGTNSHFNIRHTDLHPSKSALIGMLAAAFGYKRDQDKEIQELNKIDFALRVDQIGAVTKDFQVARHEYNKKNVYLTDRYYLEDSIFLVAIGSNDEDLMEKIEYALKNPYYQLFLGRKSVPINADFFIEKNNYGPIQNLKTYPWLAQKWYKDTHLSNLSIYADKDLIDENENLSYSEMRKDRVLSFSKKERIFKNRSEARIDINIEKLQDTDHDIFENVKE
ncbi:MAG: type I-E CRISPR-associated protein Cas5/CasD [Peptoniphilaceae bacterium]|nr:type I-E CRISPR-associated protein Cas5/CasD [Peptoniphilaceae bacterium]MDY6019199.1 type I-E CRISPR-associated protein Cas5/CasD [Anaerococcus sp.]